MRARRSRRGRPPSRAAPSTSHRHLQAHLHTPSNDSYPPADAASPGQATPLPIREVQPTDGRGVPAASFPPSRVRVLFRGRRDSMPRAVARPRRAAVRVRGPRARRWVGPRRCRSVAGPSLLSVRCRVPALPVPCARAGHPPPLHRPSRIGLTAAPVRSRASRTAASGAPSYGRSPVFGHDPRSGARRVAGEVFLPAVFRRVPAARAPVVGPVRAAAPRARRVRSALSLPADAAAGLSSAVPSPGRSPPPVRSRRGPYAVRPLRAAVRPCPRRPGPGLGPGAVLVARPPSVRCRAPGSRHRCRVSRSTASGAAVIAGRLPLPGTRPAAPVQCRSAVVAALLGPRRCLPGCSPLPVVARRPSFAVGPLPRRCWSVAGPRPRAARRPPAVRLLVPAVFRCAAAVLPVTAPFLAPWPPRRSAGHCVPAGPRPRAGSWPRRRPPATRRSAATAARRSVTAPLRDIASPPGPGRAARLAVTARRPAPGVGRPPVRCRGCAAGSRPPSGAPLLAGAAPGPAAIPTSRRATAVSIRPSVLVGSHIQLSSIHHGTPFINDRAWSPEACWFRVPPNSDAKRDVRTRWQTGAAMEADVPGPAFGLLRCGWQSWGGRDR